MTLDGTADDEPEGTAGYESEAWTAAFVNLPKSKVVDGEAVEIVYTVAETTGYPGYTASTTEPVASGETITNTQEETKADASKAWKNADGSTTAPEGATVVFTLYADGTATDYTVTLDGTVDEAPEAAGGYEGTAWTANFVHLPKYQSGTTTEIVYTVAETTTYPGYTASTTEPVASGETITNTQETTTADASKAWKNADGSTTAPAGATVVFTLYADGEVTEYTVTLDGTADKAPTVTGGYDSEAWKAAFVNLPKYQDGTTTAIIYTVAETTGYPKYIPSTTDPVASGSTITNTREVGNLKVSKTVVSDLAADADKEFDFRVELSDKTVSGTFGDMEFTNGVAEFKLKGGDSKNAEGLPTDVEYTVTETADEDFETKKIGDTGTITVEKAGSAEFTNTRKTGDLEVTKTVVSDLAADANREFEFTVTLSDKTISGTYGDMTFTDGVATFTLKGGEKKTATGLPTTVTYTVEEKADEDFTTEKTGDTGTITAEEAGSAEFTNTRKTGDLTVTKTLISDMEADKALDFEFTVTLSDKTISGTYSDMTFTDGVAKFTLKGGESATAKGLPTTVEYTVEETPVDGFTTTSLGETGAIKEGNTTAAFTNRSVKTKVTVKKTWDDKDDIDGIRPDSITLTLTGKTGDTTVYTDTQTVKEDADGNWSYTWNDVSAYSGAQLITYTVTEEPIYDYSTTVSDMTGSVEKGYEAEVTNKHVPLVKEAVPATAVTYVDGNLVAPGSVLTYKIHYGNNTNDPGTVTVTDTIPANTTLDESSVKPSDKYKFESGTITWTLENVPAGGEGDVEFKVTVDDAAAGTTLTNKAIVKTGENEAETNTTSNPVPKKEVTGANPAGYVSVGDQLTYTISFTLPEERDNVVVTDKVPEGTKFVSADNGGTESGGTVTWKLGTKSGDVKVSFVVEVTEDALTKDEINNKASIKIGENDPVDTNEVHNKVNEPAEAKFNVTKELIVPEGAAEPESWSFDVEVTAEDGAPEADPMTGTLTNSQPTAEFGTFKFVKPGTYKYTVKEVIPEKQESYVYDKSTYTVVYTVTDNGEGKLVAECSIENNTVTVTNKLLSLIVNKYSDSNKKLKGATVTLYDENGAEIVSWKSTGKDPFDFGPYLEYGKKYEIKETKVPKGYTRFKAVIFTVDETTVGEDGTITLSLKVDKEGAYKLIDKEIPKEDTPPDKYIPPVVPLPPTDVNGGNSNTGMMGGMLAASMAGVIAALYQLLKSRKQYN